MPTKVEQKIVGYKVVTPEEKEVREQALQVETPLVVPKKELKRPLSLQSKTYRLKPPQGEHALYVTLSSTIENGKQVPFEIFFNTKNPSHIEWTNALTLTISIAFRTAIEQGTSLVGLIENLKETFGTSGVYLSKVPKKPKFVNGLVAEIGYVIEEFNNECLLWNAHSENHEVWKTVEELAEETASVSTVEEATAVKVTNPCPSCGEGMRVSEGCLVCPACAYSKCG